MLLSVSTWNWITKSEKDLHLATGLKIKFFSGEEFLQPYISSSSMAFHPLQAGNPGWCHANSSRKYRIEILSDPVMFYLDDSLESFCQVSFFKNFSTESPPVYLRLIRQSFVLFWFCGSSPCHPPSGQHMVRTTGLVPMGHSRALP